MKFDKEKFINKLLDNPEELTLDEIYVSRNNLGDEEWLHASEEIVKELVRRLRLINRSWGMK